jgi:hypothetical protein
MLEKLKSYLKDDQIFYSCLIVLVAVSSFALGRESVRLEQTHTTAGETSRVEVWQGEPVLDQPTEKEGPTAVPEVGDLLSNLVASRSGTKYHRLNCPGAKQIKEENKIYFTSAAAAAAAGYTPAANCPGL